MAWENIKHNIKISAKDSLNSINHGLIKNFHIKGSRLKYSD